MLKKDDLIFINNTYYLLADFAFHTVKYQEQSLMVCLCKDQGLLNILQYKKQNQLINSLFNATSNVYRKSIENFQKFVRGTVFQE